MRVVHALYVAWPPATCGRPIDEDLSMEYDGSTCLNWKKILSLTNNYDKVNSFLIEENVLISPNYILPKSKVLCCI
jgi:hypothetical protein